MNKVLDITILISLLSIAIIEFFTHGNYLLLAAFYSVGVLYGLYRGRIIILNNESYNMEDWKSKAMTVFKLLVLYFAVGRTLFVLTDWTEFPLYLFIPRALFYITGGIIPILYFINGLRKKVE